MMELGKKQTLRVLRKKEIGVYLGEGGSMEQGVLLPRKQVPDGIKVGDELEVFLYKDSEDRLIATCLLYTSGYYHCSKNGQGLRQCSMHYSRYDVLYALSLIHISDRNGERSRLWQE